MAPDEVPAIGSMIESIDFQWSKVMHLIRGNKVNSQGKAAAGQMRSMQKEVLSRSGIKYYVKDVAEEYVQDGYACIDLRLYPGLEIYDQMSMGKQKDLSPEIYEHIDQHANLIPSVMPLKIRFWGREIPEDEQKAIREMMKKHYSHSLLDKVWDRRSNSIHMWTMLILGAALLSLYVFLTVIEQDTVALEILGTIGSFSIWEAADCFLVERLSIRKQMRYVSQNLVQEIEFHSETDLPQ